MKPDEIRGNEIYVRKESDARITRRVISIHDCIVEFSERDLDGDDKRSRAGRLSLEQFAEWAEREVIHDPYAHCESIPCNHTSGRGMLIADLFTKDGPEPQTLETVPIGTELAVVLPWRKVTPAA